MITNRLLINDSINADDGELYTYGFFIFLSNIFYFLITILIGLIFNVFLESLIFYLTFQLIRIYAGGYHAKTETLCQIYSTISILLSIVLIKLLILYQNNIIEIILSGLTIITFLVILLLSPLDTAEKPINEIEYKYFKKMSILIAVILILILGFSIYKNYVFLFVPISISFLLESILLIAGKIKQMRRKTI